MANKKVERGTLYLSGARDRLEVRPADGKKFTPEELQAAVGGFFELLVPATKGATVYANEDGALLPGFLPNRHTWEFCKKSVYALNGYGDGWRVMGDVLAVRKVDAAHAAGDGSLNSGTPTIAQLRGKKAEVAR
jgi:hypothetical protein